MSHRNVNHGRVRPVTRSVKSLGGFTLIELMIALLLGLIVIAGVTSVFLAGQRSYRTNQALGDVQDSSRIAYELMARDMRDAGLTACGNAGRVGNVLKSSPTGGGTSTWWANWNNTIAGYGETLSDPAIAVGAGPGARVTDNDSIMLLGAGGPTSSVATHSVATATFTLSDTNVGLQPGDIFIVCDPDHAVIAQTATFATKTLTYGSSGNCSTGLGFPTDCASTSNNYQFQGNSQITKLKAMDWYIGVNPLNGSSLYRLALINNGAGGVTAERQEMVRDVTNLTIRYHALGGAAFAPASVVADWTKVDSVQVTWTVESVSKNAAIGAQPLSRKFTATTTLRNRVN